MHNVHLLLGAQCSRYSARARSYLIKKNIQYIERVPTFWTYAIYIRWRFSQATIPVLITPSGKWLVDSNLILDQLEQDYPHAPVQPTDPVHAVFASLADAWGSETWLPVDLGTRWMNAENYPWWREEIGEGFIQGLPKFLKNAFCDHVAKTFSQYIRVLGSDDPTVLTWAKTMMAVLDSHFAQHDYVLGGRASRADFALICPFFGHLSRDRTTLPLLQQHPHLHAWVWRMQQPYMTADVPDFLPTGSPLPATLQPIIRSIVEEMLPFAEATLAELSPIFAAKPKGKLPRFTAPVSYPFGGKTHTRQGITIILWYLQRTRDLIATMPEAEAQQAKDWLAEIGASALMTMTIPRLDLLGGTTLRLVG